MKDPRNWCTVRILVFRAVKSEKNSVKTPEEFINASNLPQLISSIYLPTPEMLLELPEAANAPLIP